MQTFWAEELTDDEEGQLIERVAKQVAKRKLWVPAVMALEMHKPLAYIASQAMVAFSPFVAPFVGFDNVNDYSRLLARPGALERLIRRLEEDAENDRAPKEPSE